MFNYLFMTIFTFVLILVLCTLVQNITIDIKESSNKEFGKCKNPKLTILLYVKKN